jgi:SAM-dependent methyltransferase
LPLNLLFPPAALWLQRLHLDPLWFLGAFVCLLLLYWTTYRTRVPLFSSSAEACSAVADLLPQRSNLRVMDLGCGLGGVVRRVALTRPDAHVVGFELAPLPALVAWLRTRSLRNAQISRRDFWGVHLGAYDVVYAFLSPAPMPELWRKARAEMRPGAMLISNSFEIPDVAPQRRVALHGRGSVTLYVWQM